MCHMTQRQKTFLYMYTNVYTCFASSAHGRFLKIFRTQEHICSIFAAGLRTWFLSQKNQGRYPVVILSMRCMQLWDQNPVPSGWDGNKGMEKYLVNDSEVVLRKCNEI
jgi:hypothetical protein